MPWCDTCSKFWNPPELGGARQCPLCGAVVTPPAGAAAAAPQGTSAGVAMPAAPARPPALAGSGIAGGHRSDAGPAAAKPKGAPWHFKLLVAGVTVYMIYRIYWLIEWLPRHI